MNYMNAKISILLLALTLFIGASSASTLGTYVSEESKDIDNLETTFKINVMNLGDETIDAKLETSDLEDADVIHDENIEIEPSIVTTNPSEENLADDQEWFLLGDGEYVAVQEIPITVGIYQERGSNNFELNAVLETSEQNQLETEQDDEDDVAPQQEIIQTREFDFRLTTSAERDSAGNTEGGQEDNEDSVETDSLGSLGGSGFGSGGGGSSITDSATESSGLSIANEGDEDDTSIEDSENQEQSDNDIDTGEDSTDSSTTDNLTGDFLATTSANLSTIVLLITSTLSLFYLVRVM